MSPAVIDHTALAAVFVVAGSNFDMLDYMVLAFNVLEAGEVVSQETGTCVILSSDAAELTLGEIPSEGLAFEVTRVYGEIEGTEVELWHA